MINPNMPNMPGMGPMTDTLEFVKNLWGGMGLPGANMSSMNMPGMVIPTLSVEEIRKKVSDLKAVETWLELNMNMLRSTIQALEVQAATIATLQSMSDAMMATAQAGAGQASQPKASASSAAFSTAGEQQRAAAPAPEPTPRDQQDAANLTAPLVNAAAWWNLLQDQFRQAVVTAMPPGDGAGGAAPANPGTTPDVNRPGRETEPGQPAPAPRRRGRRTDD